MTFFALPLPDAHEFLLAFVPLFVVLDPVGLVPVFLGLTGTLDPARRRRLVWQSAATAIAVAVGFIFLGRWVFNLMGIRMCDFMVAGGILLFLLAMMDLLAGLRFRAKLQDVGAVPLGTPLIAGPATLTTLLMLQDKFGLTVTLAAFAANMILLTACLLGAGGITRVLGQAGTRVISKVFNLILAAIAVMLVREGVTAMIANFTAAAE